MAELLTAAQAKAKAKAAKAGGTPEAGPKPTKGKTAAPTAPLTAAKITGPIIPGVKILGPNIDRTEGETSRSKVIQGLSAFKKSFSGAILDENYEDTLCPTGSIVLDTVLGLGGFPMQDRLVQVQGEEHCGKSTIYYGYAANYQRLTGGHVAYFDHELAGSPSYLRGCGVNTNPEFLTFARPLDFDEALKMVIELRARGVKCFIFDSVPDMRTAVAAKLIKAGKAMNVQPGDHARAFKQFLNVIRTHTRGCQLLFVNQIRDLIATSQADQSKVKYQTIDKPAYVVPGGRALKFASSLTLEAMKGKAFNKAGEDDEWLFPEITQNPDGAKIWRINRTAIRVMKNKVNGGGYRAYHLYTRPGMGIDDNISIRELARGYDLIRGNSGGWVVGMEGCAPIATYRNQDLCKQALIFDEDPLVLAALKEQVAQAIFDEDAARFRYERTARDKFLAGDITPSAAKRLGVTGAVDFETEEPGTSDGDEEGGDDGAGVGPDDEASME